MTHRTERIPFLARHSVQRTLCGELTGEYSPETAMWMIDTNHGPKPMIDSKGPALETLTKTFVERETDDDAALELMSKTEADRERDD